MEKPKISQSLIKSLTSYFDDNIKDCGKKIYYQYFERLPTKTTDVMKLGIYFEYKCTGYAPKPEDIPQAEKVYVGTSREKVAADYERADKSAMLYKDILKYHKIEVLGFAESLEHDGCTGLLDMIAKFNGEECIIDLKYTALIDDKFSEYGWHTPSLQYKSNLLIQPIHYKWLAKNVYGKEYPFYFFIFSSKNEVDAKIIRTNIQEEQLILHEEVTIKKAKQYIDYFYNDPSKLLVRPNYKRCMACSYFDVCEHKATLPTIEDVYF